jgi:hypothetical protein
MVRAWSTFCTFAPDMTKIYAALALVIASATSAWAQYVYIDFSDTTVSVNQGFADVDFNQDSIADLRFTLLRDTGTTGLISAVLVSPLDSARIQVVGQQRGAYYYPNRLAVGDSISRSSSLWQGTSPSAFYGYLDYRFNGQHDPYAQWQAPYSDGFLGLRRNVNDTVINGWVRLEIAADGKSFTLKDAGYQAADDSVMFAGHIWIGLDADRDLEGYTWRQHSDRLEVLRPAGQSPRSFGVVDALGRLVLRGTWAGDEVAVPTTFLAPGAYWFVSEGVEGEWHFGFRTELR